MKEIRLSRRELVWEEYVRTWNENDFEEVKKWLSNRTEDPHCMTRYNAMKDISFDELCDMLDGKIEDVTYTLECGSEEHSWSYNESVTDYVRELMRDEAWDYGLFDSWGADDSEEDFEVLEDKC